MDPDLDLVHDCRSPDAHARAEAFRRLVDLYRDRVYNIALRIIGNPSDALDASQETFIIIHRKIDRFRFDSKFSSWVYRIAVNASIDLKRKDQVNRRIASDGAPNTGAKPLEVVEAEEHSPHREIGAQELEGQVQQAISKLSEKLRAVVVLRYTQGLSYEEVSDVMKCSIGTVKSRLARAHDALEKSLEKVLERHYFE